MNEGWVQVAEGMWVREGVENKTRDEVNIGILLVMQELNRLEEKKKLWHSKSLFSTSTDA